MTSKPSINSFDNDFGFTFADEQELAQAAVREHVDDKTELTNKLQEMYDTIMPLLVNLSKNPEQDIIKWPKRKAKIVEFKAKLDKIGGDYIKVKVI
jgi:hypothetical protein